MQLNSNWIIRDCRWFKSIALSAIALGLSTALAPETARGDIFVTYPLGTTIGDYSNSGATVNSALITGLNGPEGIIAIGSNLYETNFNSSSVGEYTTSGSLVTASLNATSVGNPSSLAVLGSTLVTSDYTNQAIAEFPITGGTVSPYFHAGISYGIAVSGSDIFETNFNGTTVSEYTTSGTLLNASFITGLNSPLGIAVSGSDIFVVNYTTGTVGEYDLFGNTVNASLITGLTTAHGIAISGSDIYVAEAFGSGPSLSFGRIGEFTLGAAPGTITSSNPSLVTDLAFAWGIAVTPDTVPEPSTGMLICIAGTTLLVLRQRRNRA